MNFSKSVLNWYNFHKRDLPWRNTKNPYLIWVSEIILQQTRVEQGLPYYYKFTELFPDVASLAKASEEQVLKVWEGLGYYTRARNMHHTAQLVMEKFDGRFPSDSVSLRQLKGIGSYTAAAIASVCNNEPIAAIDANVVRVLSRYFGVLENAGTAALMRSIGKLSEQLVPENAPGDYNQAVMDFGAMVCTPARPACDTCLMTGSCYAFNNKMTGVLPAKKKSVKRKERFLNYLRFRTPEGRVVLRKRTSDDIWKNLWELPLIESDRLMNPDEIAVVVGQFINTTHFNFNRTTDIDHILSHQLLHARFFSFDVTTEPELQEDSLVLANPDDERYPVPRLIEKILKKEK